MATKKKVDEVVTEDVVKEDAKAEAVDPMEEYVEVELFRDGGKYSNDVYVSVNGENCIVQRGVPVKIKRKFYEVIQQSMAQDIKTASEIAKLTMVGANCVVGNSVELKNVILFDHVQTPHYNYVGDSILGYFSHMGAGSITSNVKSDKKLVVVHNGTEQIETGIKKFGAMLGDYVEVGCNAVCNPGTVIGRHSSVYPTSCVRGVIPENCIFKNSGTVIERKAD